MTTFKRDDIVKGTGMLNQRIVPPTTVLLSIFCSSLFSYGSVASTQDSLQGLAAHNATTQASDNAITLGSATALVASVDGIQFNGMAEFNDVAEFARQVSGFHHESGGDMGIDTSRSGGNSGYLPRHVSSHNDVLTVAANNEGTTSGETGTLWLIMLGLAALCLSRRRIKFALIASNQLSDASNQGVVSCAPMNAYKLILNPARHSQCAAESQTTEAEATDSGVEVSTNIITLADTEAHTTDRNPYPDLAQSVQKLEALAHEMAQFS